jgi:hypothetical protein
MCRNVLETLYFLHIIPMGGRITKCLISRIEASHTHTLQWIKEKQFIYTHTWLNNLRFEENIFHHCSLAACIVSQCAFDFCCVNVSVNCMSINSFKQHDSSDLCAFSFNMIDYILVSEGFLLWNKHIYFLINGCPCKVYMQKLFKIK